MPRRKTKRSSTSSKAAASAKRAKRISTDSFDLDTTDHYCGDGLHEQQLIDNDITNNEYEFHDANNDQEELREDLQELEEQVYDEEVESEDINHADENFAENDLEDVDDSKHFHDDEDDSFPEDGEAKSDVADHSDIVGLDTRSEASSDKNAETMEEVIQNQKKTRTISPIVFDCEDSSSEEEDINENESLTPPGESNVVLSRKEIVLPPVEVRAERRERHTKMLKYLFREAHFYLIKSNNFENISLSKARGVWSTPPSNEAKLTKSFKEARNVILIFSVRESGAFQGFARLMSKARHDLSPIHWVLPVGLSAKALGGVFKITWLCRRELSFAKTLDIYNAFNSNKPVKIGRDGQEIEPNAGKMLCLEFPQDDKVDLEDIIHRVRKDQKASGGPPAYRPQHPTEIKREPPSSIQDKSSYQPYKPAYRNTPIRGKPNSYNSRNSRPYRGQRNERPRNNYSRYDQNASNGSYSHNNHRGYQHSSSSAQLSYRPSSNLYSSHSYSTYSSYNSYNPYSEVYHDAHHPSQPSSAVVPIEKYVPSSSKYSSSSNRVSSRSGGGSSSNRSYEESGSLSKRVYDSRSHAAACDDFVRRVASGKSALSSSSERSRSARDSYSHSGRRSPVRQHRSERSSRYRR